MNRNPFAISLSAAVVIATLPVAEFAIAAADARIEDVRQTQQTAPTSPQHTPRRDGTQPSETTARTAQATGISNDGQALAMLTAINKHEIALAELARQKQGLRAAVQHYAQMLQEEHSANQVKTREVRARANAGAGASPALTRLEEKNMAERRKLEALNGTAFEESFVQAMIQDHTDALHIIDTQLLPAAKDPEVQRHLRDTRDHMAKHLEKARALERDVANRNGAR